MNAFVEPRPSRMLKLKDLYVFNSVVVIVVVVVVWAKRQERKRSRRAPGYFAILVTRLHQPHAIVVKLHVRKSNVVILTPEKAGTVGV